MCVLIEILRILHPMDDPPVLLFSVRIDDAVTAVCLGEVYQHAFRIRFRMKLHSDELRRNPDGHCGSLQVHMRTNLLVGQNAGAEFAQTTLVRLHHLPVPEICGIKGIFEGLE